MTQSQEILTAKIETLSHEGRGIAHINGKITFIEGALPGEEVEFVYLKKRSKYDEAKAIRIINASPSRTTPKCQHFDICGGCLLQHMSQEAQVTFKTHVLLEQLTNVGVKPEHVLPPITDSNFGYRRRARLGVKYVIKKNKVLVGFHERNGRFLADIESCSILHPNVGERIKPLSDMIRALSIYDQIPQIEVACGDDNFALVFRCLSEPSQKDLEELQNFSKTYSAQIFIQKKGPKTCELLFSPNQESLSYKLDEHNLEFFFLPTDFVQINSNINKRMISLLLELLEPQKNDTILDLFCGLGNLTLVLAHYCGEALGIEGDDCLIERAKANAAHNLITNAKFYHADLNSKMPNEICDVNMFDKIVLDPPRTGAFEICKNLSYKAKKLVYISCNSITFARDSVELIKKGYKLNKVCVLDMFPHTGHAESIALFTLPLSSSAKADDPGATKKSNV